MLSATAFAQIRVFPLQFLGDMQQQIICPFTAALARGASVYRVDQMIDQLAGSTINQMLFGTPLAGVSLAQIVMVCFQKRKCQPFSTVQFQVPFDSMLILVYQNDVKIFWNLLSVRERKIIFSREISDLLADRKCLDINRFGTNVLHIFEETPLPSEILGGGRGVGEEEKIRKCATMFCFQSSVCC